MTIVSRREALAAVTAGALAAIQYGCHRSELNGSTATLRGDPTRWSAGEMAQAVRSRVISSEQLVNACLQRIEKVNSKLNAVVRLRREGALADARRADELVRQGGPFGSLHGVPMTIKDSFDTAGIISTAGTKGRASFIPTSDATVVARLKAAGAILLGKTNTPEFTLSVLTDNLVYGRTDRQSVQRKS